LIYLLIFSTTDTRCGSGCDPNFCCCDYRTATTRATSLCVRRLLGEKMRETKAGIALLTRKNNLNKIYNYKKIEIDSLLCSILHLLTLEMYFLIFFIFNIILCVFTFVVSSKNIVRRSIPIVWGLYACISFCRHTFIEEREIMSLSAYIIVVNCGYCLSLCKKIVNEKVNL
jgi:hypothetical protein